MSSDISNRRLIIRMLTISNGGQFPLHLPDIG